MITRPTTLVLGAGASIPYGFPSGAELTEKVVTVLGKENSTESKILRDIGFDRKEIEGFAESLRLSGKHSVDAFLEHRPNFIELGKAAIACCLIPSEVPDRLFKREDDWYQNLYAAMNTDPGQFQRNVLRVVTFNYDRSLEHYLFTCLSNSYGLEQDEAADLVRTVPIIHVHGKLGNLPWETASGGARAYAPDLSRATVHAARGSIRVIHEHHDSRNGTPLSHVRKRINGSEVLVFVGFGYLRPNLDRLGIDLKKERVFAGGSCYGFTELEKLTASRHLPQGFSWGDPAWKALRFLRERVEMI